MSRQPNINLVRAYQQGAEDSQDGMELNPYEYGSDEWEAYNDGALDHCTESREYPWLDEAY